MQPETINNAPINNSYEDYIEQKPPIEKGFGKIQKNIFNVIESIISTENKEDITIKELLNDKFLDLDFGFEYDIDADKISAVDALFFINILNENNIINYNVEENNITSVSFNNKPLNISKSLLNVLQGSFDTKKPVRLDFDKDVTVILRMDKDGKIHTHFVPGSTEVENYLKNNLIVLKQRFDEEEINYSTISYSKHKENSKNGKNSKKEDK